MAEINLLSNNTPRPSVSKTLSSIFVKTLAVLLLLVLVYFGYIFFALKNTSNASASETEKINQDQQDILSNKNRSELLIRQSQLKEAENLIENHVYWSRFFKDIAQATLKTTSYSDFSSQGDGNITVSLTVPDYKTLDEFLQVFDLPQFNKNFSNVRIISVAKTTQGSVPSLKVKVRFQYNIDVLKGDTK